MQTSPAPAETIRWTTTDLGLLEGDRRNRYEIIAGELFVTRAPRWKHQTACGKIATLLNLWIREGGFGQVAVGPGIVFSDTDHVIPDVVWATDETLANSLDESGRLTAALELIVEVLLPGAANERRDRDAKLKLYSL